MKRGKLITLYGINNIGKSTQAKILIDNLKKHGYDAVYIKYPIYNLEPTGPFINKSLRGTEEDKKIDQAQLQMWFALNRYQYENTLEEMLIEGKIVVAEDYTCTGLAWGSANGVNLDWLIEINKYLMKEDLAIYMKGKRNLQARENNHAYESNDDLSEACMFIYDNLAVKFDWKKVNVKHSIGETADDIWNTVHNFLKNS
jgi:dTMP kinase